VVVLDSSTGEVLALANYPSYNPDRRQNLTGEQLRNIALTDTFEPGLHHEAITVAAALETGRRQAQHHHRDGTRAHTDHGFTIRRAQLRRADVDG
jgi:cell division protein FtsI (penicillin-binding protein 3)